MPNKKRTVLLAGLFAALASFAHANDVLRLATTTSVENSGLLNHLLPDYKARCGCDIRVLPVGSGKALALGRRGDADLLITHSPAAEADFVADGYGTARLPVMYNSFVLLGPESAWSDVDGIESVMSAIADEKARFLSRGDDSGTHKKEQELWRLIETRRGRAPDFSPEWYISAGSGMGQAILMADELRAYVLSDRGTYLYFRDRVDLRVVVENTPPLINPYSAIPINPRRHPHVNHARASDFVDWLTSPPTQERINRYRLLGETLFTAGAPPAL